jgi:predicted NACHT family NTPase
VDAQRQLVGEILEFGNQYKRSKIVIATRPTGIMSIPGFRAWILQPFNRQLTNKFFEKWFAKRPILKDRILQDLKNHDLVEKVPPTPIVLTLMAILVEQQENVELPANLSELYQMFTDLLLGKWSLDRRINTMFNANVKAYLINEIAVYLHRNKLITLASDIVRAIVTDIIVRKGWQYDPDQVFAELLEGESLLYKNDFGEVGFRHSSFQEFFVARKMLDEHMSPSEIIERFNDRWWQSPIYFYAGLKKDNATLLPLIAKQIQTKDLESFWPAFWHFGYLLQASYTTDIEVREQCLLLLIRECAGAMEKAIENPEMSQFPTESVGFMVLMLLIITR